MLTITATHTGRELIPEPGGEGRRMARGGCRAPVPSRPERRVAVPACLGALPPSSSEGRP
jgi:hypothetical protein